MTAKVLTGKLFPWALAAVASLLEALGVKISWWPTVVLVTTGVVNFIISKMK